MDLSNYLIVAALDLGFTDSGYAFSFKQEFQTDPLTFHANQCWSAGDKNVLSLKTPTCVLLDEDKELKAFGYLAEKKFEDIILDEEQNNYYFFRGFYIQKNFNRDTMLIDATGRSLPASHVFKCLIKAFVNHIMEHLDLRTSDLTKDEIRWVIPVSANWTDSDKQFLRTCAVQAGICSDQLMLVTDAEAAFIYCEQVVDRDHYQKSKDGFECMVVQLGGTTRLQLGGNVAGITVLTRDTNQVIEKYRVTGNDCDYTSVNNRYLEFLCEIFGSQVMTSLRKEYLAIFSSLERDFIGTTSRVRENENRRINMPVPYVTLDSLCVKFYAKNIGEIVSSSMYGSGISMWGDKMRINSDMIHNLFKPTIDNIIVLMENVLTDYKDAHNVKEIVMVGGFSECSLVQDALRRTFSNNNIVFPVQPELAVIKGAVLFGHQPYEYIQLTSSEMKAAQTSVTKCIFCDNPGIYHCTECTSAFCQQCRTKHDKLPTTKNHTVTDLKNMTPSAFLTEAKCVLHKSEFIYFCTKCHVLICGKCVTTEHKGHDITDIKTVADNYRRSAEGNISDLKVAVTKLSKVVGQMKEIEKPTIKRTSDSAVAEVDASVKKITDIVSFKKENTLYEVQNQLDIEIEEFQYDLKNKERMYEHQNNICESLQRLVHVSHDITFITSYETLKRDIHDISDLVGERGHEQMYKFDKKGFVQEVVNAIVSNFEMCLVGKEDGSVVLTHKTDIKKKEKE